MQLSPSGKAPEGQGTAIGVCVSVEEAEAEGAGVGRTIRRRGRPGEAPVKAARAARARQARIAGCTVREP